MYLYVMANKVQYNTKYCITQNLQMYTLRTYIFIPFQPRLRETGSMNLLPWTYGKRKGVKVSCFRKFRAWKNLYIACKIFF